MLYRLFGNKKISDADIVKRLKDNLVLKAVKGTITFDVADPFTVTLGTIPAGAVIVATLVNVKTVFNAATTNVLVVGHGASLNEQVAAGDVNEAATGLTQVPTALAALSADKVIKAKYTQTGTAATTGAADVTVLYLV